MAFIEKLPFKKHLAEVVFQSYAKDKALGKVREVDPMQFFMSVLGMCIFPFVGRPILESVLGVERDKFSNLMIQRIPEIKLYIRTILKVE